MIAADIFIAFMVLLGFLGAFSLGVVRGRGLGRRSAAVNTSQCPCGHQWGAHRKGMDCQDRVYRGGDGWRHCACTRYHGPEVFIASDLLGPGAIGK
jgi:hypothetical protein